VAQFKEVQIPEGDLIDLKDGQLVVGDHPIIGYLRGDGIGLDITPTMMIRDAAPKLCRGFRERGV